jgi:hypothetical protein
MWGDRMPLSSVCLIFLLALPATTPQAGTPSQTSTQSPQTTQSRPQPGTAKVRPEDLPVSLDRIQAALAKTPMLRFDKESRPVFRVQVFGDRPTIEDILGPDYVPGPVPHGSLTHQEFLQMVTPKDVQGYAAFSNEEGAVVASTSLLFQWTLQKAIQKFNETRDEREREAARKEVLDALNALEQARAKAGLPRK